MACRQAQGGIEEVRALVAEHAERTGSTVAAGLLQSWDDAAARFVKVMPRDYKRALAELAQADADAVAKRSQLGAPA